MPSRKFDFVCSNTGINDILSISFQLSLYISLRYTAHTFSLSHSDTISAPPGYITRREEGKSTSTELKYETLWKGSLIFMISFFLSFSLAIPFIVSSSSLSHAKKHRLNGSAEVWLFTRLLTTSQEKKTLFQFILFRALCEKREKNNVPARKMKRDGENHFFPLLFFDAILIFYNISFSKTMYSTYICRHQRIFYYQCRLNIFQYTHTFPVVTNRILGSHVWNRKHFTLKIMFWGSQKLFGIGYWNGNSNLLARVKNVSSPKSKYE